MVFVLFFIYTDNVLVSAVLTALLAIALYLVLKRLYQSEKEKARQK